MKKLHERKIKYIPQIVSAVINSDKLTLKGSLGSMTIRIPKELTVTIEPDQIKVELKYPNLSLLGTYSSLISNAIRGVTYGFLKKLKLVGVGYRASLEENKLILRLGYSNSIVYNVPKDVNVRCPKPSTISIFGINKELVGKVASEIRSFRKPEPYKGKGVSYDDEVIVKKEGKRQ